MSTTKIKEESFLNKKTKPPQKKVQLCQVCKQNEYKYTCPRCLYKTCSVKCVQLHKNRFKCTGQRDKFKKVNSKKDYNEKVFYRDINFMNESLTKINMSNRKVFGLTENIDKPQSKISKNFKRICKKFRNITYFKSPNIMKCNEYSKSYSDSITKKFFWTVKFNFIEMQLSHIFSQIQFDDEVETLRTISEYLYEHKSEVQQPELLKYLNNKAWIEEYKIYLRVNIQGMSEDERKGLFKYQKYFYSECENNKMLKDVLYGHEVYEFPEFYLLKGK